MRRFEKATFGFGSGGIEGPAGIAEGGGCGAGGASPIGTATVVVETVGAWLGTVPLDSVGKIGDAIVGLEIVGPGRLGAGALGAVRPGWSPP